MPAVSQEQPNRALMGALLRNIDSANSHPHLFWPPPQSPQPWRPKVLQSPSSLPRGFAIYLAQLHPNETPELHLRPRESAGPFHDQFSHSAQTGIMTPYMGCGGLWGWGGATGGTFVFRKKGRARSARLIFHWLLNLVLKRLLPRQQLEAIKCIN